MRLWLYQWLLYAKRNPDFCTMIGIITLMCIGSLFVGPTYNKPIKPHKELYQSVPAEAPRGPLAF